MRYSVSSVALAASLLASAANAQTAAPSPPTASTAPVAPSPPDASTDNPGTATSPSPATGSAPPNDIVVTGSRISRRDLVSSSPLVTVNPAVLKSTGSPTVEDALNIFPQFTASANGAASGAGSASNRSGQASADLRALGQQRTLVLLDGRRLQPGGADGAVDLNTVPTSLIDGVEVITGGASAAYGSDAVAGVVNFKLKTHFQGLQLDTQEGITERGDGGTQDVNLTAGSDFADHRGNVVFNLSFSNRQSVRPLDRDFFRYSRLTAALPEGSIGTNATNLPSQAAVDAVFARYGVAAGTVSRNTAFSFNSDGTLFNANPIVNFRDPSNHIYNNGQLLQYSTGDEQYLQLPLRRYAMFGRANYEITDNISAYFQGYFTDYKATVSTAAPVLGAGGTPPATVPVTNPFIPADLAAILASRPNPTAPFALNNKRLNETGDRLETDTYDVFQLVTGLTGKLPSLGWTWEVYGSFGRSRNESQSTGYPSLSAMNTLLAASDGGRSICAGGYNPFGLTALSSACYNYLSRVLTNITTVEQEVVEANLQGRLFDLPAGELRFATGAEYRRNSYNLRPDSLAIGGDLVNYSPIKPSGGATEVKELYAELLVPVLKDLPLIRSLNLDLAYRYSDYNTIGGVSTYKADADWKMTNFLTLRGGYARAIRAPNAGELFSALSQTSVNLGAIGPIGSGDPCDTRSGYRASGYAGSAQVRQLCLAQGIPAVLIDTFRNTTAQSVVNLSGNRGLKEETADTFSVGAVLQPHLDTPWLAHFSTTVDFYSIKLRNAIGTISAPVAVAKCFNADGSNPGYTTDNIYCAAISRLSASGLIDTINTPLLNLGGYRTSGIDVQVDWSLPLSSVGASPSLGTVRLNSVIGYLRTFKIQNLPNVPFQEFAGTILNTQIDPFADAHPRWKTTTTASWEIGPIATSLRWRYLSGMSNANNVGNTGTAPGVKSVSYFDLDLRWKLFHNVDLRAGVTNLTDVPAPQVSNIVGNTDYATYDLLGRRYYLGLRVSL